MGVISHHPSLLRSSTVLNYYPNDLNETGGYYTVKVLEINEAETSVIFRIHMFNPDGTRIYESVGFGLQMLINSEIESSLLASELDMDDLCDPDWARRYANGFVKSVTKEPIGTEGTDALLTVYCTDKAWLSHLSVGEEWESAAYEVSRSYDPCEPIMFGVKKSNSTDSFDFAEYWMPVPSFLFSQSSHRLPNVVYIPRYTGSSYMVSEVMELSGEDQTPLKELHGKFVKVLDDNEAGLLVWNGGKNHVSTFSIGDGYRGRNNYSLGRPIIKIGLLSPKSHYNRQNVRTSYARIFSGCDPMIKSAKRMGKEITLEVAGIVDVDELRLTKGSILKMICNNYVKSANTVSEIDSEFPLSKLLRYFADKKGDYYDPDNVLNDIADGVIVSYQVDDPENSLENFDALDHDSLVDYFKNENWPCHIFHIVISDEAFGLQVDEITKVNETISLIGTGGEVMKWDRPILWKDYRDLISNQ